MMKELLRHNRVIFILIYLILALDLFFKIHCICANVQTLSRFGSVIANSGFNCLTEKKVFSKTTTKAILPMMLLCGMSINSG